MMTTSDARKRQEEALRARIELPDDTEKLLAVRLDLTELIAELNVAAPSGSYVAWVRDELRTILKAAS